VALRAAATAAVTAGTIHVSSRSALDSVAARLHSFDLSMLLSPDYPQTFSAS
jgi:hypothetical protein